MSPEHNPPHHPARFHHVSRPFRHLAAEWCPIQRRWYQDGRELRNVKASKALIWPKDGRNSTTWGRVKDIFLSRGPDIFLTVNADKHDYMRNRPSKDRWAGYSSFDGAHGPAHVRSGDSAPWTQKGSLGGRMPGLKYDFRTRKYEVPVWASWTDAVWQPEPRKNKSNRYPEAYRDVHGDWFQDLHYRPWYRGGPVHNEQGVGIPGFYLRSMR